MLAITIQSQPTAVTCGPTSLHAIYNYYEDNISLDQIINEIDYGTGGGTLAVLLASHALKRGYRAKIYTYNLDVFDPTWFPIKGAGDPQLIKKKLEAQAEVKQKAKLQWASHAYMDFLDLGGALFFQDLTPRLLTKFFNKKIPILTGLSATYLYRSAREYAPDDQNTEYNDITGEASGHFVVLCGYNENSHDVIVADPYPENPQFQQQYYAVKVNRLINAIMLGVLTYDANFLIIEK